MKIELAPITTSGKGQHPQRLPLSNSSVNASRNRKQMPPL